MRSPGADGPRALREVAVAELAVRKPVTERELRRDGQVVVAHRVFLEIRIGGAARGVRGVVERHRAGGARERRRQAAGGRILAEQHVGHARCRLRRPASRFRGWPAAFSASHGSASGRPLASTTTTGLPVASTRRASSSWLAGSSRSERLRASPERSKSSPITSTVTSADFARASPRRECRRDRRLRGSAPGADDTFSVFGAAAVMPCEDRDDFFGLALRAPRAERRQPVGGQRADHRDAAQLRPDSAAAACRRS